MKSVKYTNGLFPLINTKVRVLAFVLVCLLSITLINCKSDTEKRGSDIDDTIIEENQNNTETPLYNDTATENQNQMAEWNTYKNKANEQIAKNEAQINSLTEGMNKPGSTFDANYKKNIRDLKERNEALKKKISDYDNNQTDWESFKREFDSDMEGLGNALRNLTVNNKK